jgi:hypothetical protein
MRLMTRRAQSTSPYTGALSALVSVPPADVELIFMSIQAHEQERKILRAQRAREAAVATRQGGY